MLLQTSSYTNIETKKEDIESGNFIISTGTKMSCSIDPKINTTKNKTKMTYDWGGRWNNEIYKRS